MESNRSVFRASVFVLAAVGLLAGARLAPAAVFKVGAGGTHSTVQAAINSALATPEPDEIRLRGNRVFRENLVMFANNENVIVSGGWNAAFTSAPPAARSTLDGRGLGPVLDISQQGGVITLERLRVRNGVSEASGGGIYAGLDAGARLEIRNSQVSGNSVTSETGYRQGGGALIALSDDSIVSIRGVDFANNGVKSASAGGGGLSIGHLNGVGGRATVANCTFRDNFLTVGPAPETGGGSGLLVGGSAGTVFEVVDNLFQRNSQSGEAIAYGVGFVASLSGTATIEARRNRVLDQTASMPASSLQVQFFLSGDAQGRFSDSEVGRSAMFGVSVSAYERSVMRMVNLTVVDNAQGGAGGTTTGTSVASIANSIVLGNGTYNIWPFGNLRLVRDLVGIDPLFVNRAAADYRLRDSSRARNRGMANPPGGLGPLDVAGRPRVRGGAVDQGANEIQ